MSICPYCHQPMLPYGQGYGDQTQWVCNDRSCAAHLKDHLQCPTVGCGTELLQNLLAGGSKIFTCATCDFSFEPLQLETTYECDRCKEAPMALSESQAGGFDLTCPNCALAISVKPL